MSIDFVKKNIPTLLSHWKTTENVVCYLSYTYDTGDNDLTCILCDDIVYLQCNF